MPRGILSCTNYVKDLYSMVLNFCSFFLYMYLASKDYMDFKKQQQNLDIMFKILNFIQFFQKTTTNNNKKHMHGEGQ